jgi:hypothetical protein
MKWQEFIKAWATQECDIEAIHFEIEHTPDFNDRTPTGEAKISEFMAKWYGREDRVLEFMIEWFGNEQTAKQIRTALDDAGKVLIKHLVRNPPQLALLCAFWQDNQALPETEAGLYAWLVNYLYQWKAREFPQEVRLQGELNRVLGELAKWGLNRQPDLGGEVQRFQFTEGEISSLWKTEASRLLSAAKNLGWLTVVETEAEEDVYAFFQSRFQEYFAACSITDWDYFLPRMHVGCPVPCEGESEPTYRVFEQEWELTIRLWIGREDIADELKEEFITKLTNFDEQEGQFYYFRAYFMAAICVGEFRDSQQAQAIVEQICTCAYGSLSPNQPEWKLFSFADGAFVDYDTIWAPQSQQIVPRTHREYAIETLVQILERDNWDDWWNSTNAFDGLGQIAMGNQSAIEYIVALLEQNNWNDRLRSSVRARILGQIGVGNQSAIESIVRLLEQDNWTDSYRSDVMAEILGKIGVGNQSAIASLVRLLKHGNLTDWNSLEVARTLSQIDEGNQSAISALVRLLELDDLDDNLYLNVARTLGQIDEGNQSAISAVVRLLERDDLDADFRFNAIEILGEIDDEGNQSTIESIIQLLEQDNWNHQLRSDVMAKILAQIGVGNQYAIASLVRLLEQGNLTDWNSLNVARTLDQIDAGNQSAISALAHLLELDDLDDNLCLDVARTLGQIDEGNRVAISTLVHLLERDDLEDDFRFNAIETLCLIDEENQSALSALVRLLEQVDWNKKNPSNNLRLNAIETLEQIDGGNQSAISALVQLFEQDNLDNALRLDVASMLSKFDEENQSAIVALVELLKPDDLDNDLDSGSSLMWRLQSWLTKQTMPSVIWELKHYCNDKYCYSIIFYCATVLTYSTFHAAWHLE